MSESDFPGFQFAFYGGVDGGQFVFRADTMDGLESALEDFTASLDESDGPGLLTKLQEIEAAGLVKAQFKNGNRQGGNGGSTSAPAKSDSDIPGWLQQEAQSRGGVAVTGISAKNNKRWFAVDVGGKRQFVQAPQGN